MAKCSNSPPNYRKRRQRGKSPPKLFRQSFTDGRVNTESRAGNSRYPSINEVVLTMLSSALELRPRPLPPPPTKGRGHKEGLTKRARCTERCFCSGLPS